MEEMLKDERFAHVARDPKFRRIPKAERKVKIDKRFQSMFKDKKFSVKYTVDKRGRPVTQSSNENLKKYYDLPSDEDSEERKIDLKKNKSKKDKHSRIDNEKLSKTEKGKSKKTKKIESQEKLYEKDNVNKKKSVVKLKNNKENKDEEEEDIDNVGSLIRLKKVKDKKLNQGDKKENNSTNAKVEDEEFDSNEASEEEDEDSDYSEDLEENETDEDKLEEESDNESSNEYLLDSKKNKKELKLKRKDDEDEEQNLPEEVKQKLRDLRVDYARGEGVLFSDSSSSEEEDSEEYDEDDDIVHSWGEFDKDAETTDTITNRLAVCNMDWDRIRAVDLMILFSSFLPEGHLINSVTIYPSEFGLERMKEEEIKGPKELVETKLEDCEVDNEDSDEDKGEGSSYHREKLRQYQLNRLKYYYAIVVCDSPESADKIYTECDGYEYELTGARIDLRFVPDDITFDQKPREVCDKLPDMTKYQPRQFITTALQQVKVDLTWDETDPDRVEIFQKLNEGKLDEVDENELRNYLASGSSDEESEQETEKGQNEVKFKKTSTIEKYKELLKSIDAEEEERKKDKKMEFEVSWDMDAKEKAEQLIKDGAKNENDLTPFEKYLEKRKDKKKVKREEKKKLKKQEEEGSDSEDSIPAGIDMNDPYFAEELQSIKKSSKKRKAQEIEEVEDSEEKLRKAELELLLMDKDEGKKHFNMKKIEELDTMTKSKKKRLEKKKKKIDIDNDFQVDVEDPRFAALYSSHHFNIDPSDPHYRKTKGTEALVQEKIKKRSQNDDNKLQKETHSETEKEKSKSKNTELSALVKSVKRKASRLKK